MIQFVTFLVGMSLALQEGYENQQTTHLHTEFRRDRFEGYRRVGGKNASLGELFNSLGPKALV